MWASQLAMSKNEIFKVFKLLRIISFRKKKIWVIYCVYLVNILILKIFTFGNNTSTLNPI